MMNDFSPGVHALEIFTIQNMATIILQYLTIGELFEQNLMNWWRGNTVLVDRWAIQNNWDWSASTITQTFFIRDHEI